MLKIESHSLGQQAYIRAQQYLYVVKQHKEGKEGETKYVPMLSFEGVENVN